MDDHGINGSGTGRDTRGRFGPGNPGRPKGARHKATVAAQTLLDGEAEALTRKAVELAFNGDTTALRLVLERILPPRKDRPVFFDLPPIERAGDAAKGAAAIAQAVADGDLTPSEAAAVSNVIDVYLRSLIATEFEERLARLEQNAERET